MRHSLAEEMSLYIHSHHPHKMHHPVQALLASPAAAAAASAAPAAAIVVCLDEATELNEQVLQESLPGLLLCLLAWMDMRFNRIQSKLSKLLAVLNLFAATAAACTSLLDALHACHRHTRINKRCSPWPVRWGGGGGGGTHLKRKIKKLGSENTPYINKGKEVT